MDYDVIVIGAGLSGLTAASLLAKRGVKVAVIDRAYCPGGSCGVFKRDGASFDQGSAMLYGFGEKGFNPHRFVFNCLEEPFDVIQHDMLYCVNFDGHRVRFWADIDRFADELAAIFPSERDAIRRFYRDLSRLYEHVMVETPNYATADEADRKTSLCSLLRHPLSYARFLSYLNKDARSLLAKYFTDPEIFKFFDKLTSTYCYTNLKESPAILAAVMFVDNHIGGSYYPAGSTLFLPGRLEKVIEAGGGDLIMEREVTRILFQDGKPCGVALDNGESLSAPFLIYSGTVWNLYGKLIDPQYTTPERRQWAASQEPTLPSVVLYARVARSVLPPDTQPIEFLVGNLDEIDENEVTAYLFSIDDRTLCDEDSHVTMAIGPSLEDWTSASPERYAELKEKARQRLIDVMEKRFPGFRAGLRYSEIATPRTIERYTLKNGGAVAGPKQMLGQHMFRRLHTRTEWESLFCCGESTVMGTGTPTVTTEGLSAANAVLKRLGREPFLYRPAMPNYVRIVPKPFTNDDLYCDYAPPVQAVLRQAARCQLCEHPNCMKNTTLDIRGILRRVTVGNFQGARRRLQLAEAAGAIHVSDPATLKECEILCERNVKEGRPVEIRAVIDWLRRDPVPEEHVPWTAEQT